METSIQPGLTGESRTTVVEALTAKEMGSGSLAVFATPALVALMEAAAVAAIDPFLLPGYSSVGIELSVKHLSATPVGEEVRAQAEVIDVQGKRIIFEVRAWDNAEMIGEGTHARYLIEVEKFMRRVRGEE